MKKVLLTLSLVLGVILILPSSVFAQEHQYTDYIRIFNSDITLNQDASISVSEKIDYHFTFSRHGIYREVPVNYKIQGSFLRPTFLQLKDLSYYQTSAPNRTYTSYERSSDNGYAIFKIGDADTTLTGDYTYIINYNLIYAVNYFEDHDELYLNITGTGWDVPMDKIVANINLPGQVVDKACYTGITDSKETACTMVDLGGNRISVTAGPLDIYEGLTVVIAMPKDTIANTTSQQRIQFVLANIGILLPIVAIILVIILSKKYNTNKKITVIPNYDVPKGWNPLRSGYLYKKGLPSNIISAQIINLAINKFIIIKQVSKKNYDLIKTDKEPPTDPQELILYDGLFKNKDTVSLEDLSTQFYMVVTSLKGTTEKRLYAEDFLSTTQKKIHDRYIFFGIGGIILCFGLLVLTGVLAVNPAMGWFVGSLASFIIIAIFGSQIDLRSSEGNKMFYELEGLKMYINTAEKKRIEFHNDPKKYLGVFEKLLPYAMIFGLEKKWAKEFEDLYTEQPDWYQGNNRMFNSYLMINSLNHMNHQVVEHATPSNSANGFASSGGASGGSGFSGGSSGGGFGGGGGGSW